MAPNGNASAYTAGHSQLSGMQSHALITRCWTRTWKKSPRRFRGQPMSTAPLSISSAKPCAAAEDYLAKGKGAESCLLWQVMACYRSKAARARCPCDHCLCQAIGTIAALHSHFSTVLDAGLPETSKWLTLSQLKHT